MQQNTLIWKQYNKMPLFFEIRFEQNWLTDETWYPRNRILCVFLSLIGH